MKKWLKRITVTLLSLLVAGIGAGWWLMRGSLPALDGELALDGLSAPVSIQRDALGVVTIDAANETDALRALGYVHAQERFFEMDLMRRSATGELSELFGPIALDLDRQRRIHRIRARVDAGLAAMAAERRPQLQAYTDGVNAGLGGLRARPWPYLLLRQPPRRWELGDAALTGYAMYFDLQDAANGNELAMWRIKPHLPPALYALLARDGTAWDAPLVGQARGDAVLPGADQVDLRTLPAAPDKRHDVAADDIVPGSNNFAVSGKLTADGRAIVADDMHLGLRAPGIWFRARLRYPDPRAAGGKVDVTGFTLPGLPAVVVGSNTRVAWAFTNSYIDTADWKLLRACGTRADDAAATAPGPACVTPRVHRESIRVAGAPPVVLDVEDTAWGPVLHRDGDTLFALRWNGHLDGALGFGLTGFLHARDLDDAMAIADRSAVPTQNLLIGDASGRIAWRLIGPIAQRAPGCDGALPTGAPPAPAAVPASTAPGTAAPAATPAQTPATGASSADPCPAWGIATDRSPRVVDPADGRLWTANNRTQDGDTLAGLGDGGYAFAARARQIRDGLFARQSFVEADLLAIQLDDRALLIGQWRGALADAATRAKSPALAELAAASTAWGDGRAGIDSTAYRIVRAWRMAVHARVAEGLTAPAHAALGERFEMPAFQQLEGVVWPLLAQRPPHLLSRRFKDWNALLEDAAVEVRDDLVAQGPLAQRTWGERNTAAICHPLSGAIPVIGKRLLCMPADKLSGDGGMPRVVGPGFGASERMVVSPGHEADGITHMPGGQSGHPMSPFWGAGHDDWVQGRPTPFLPGRTTHTLRLAPAR